ncbi:hypothetical protein [Spiribacter sp. SSL99]|uniref:hypothetical protein n=1 Tax=Spiribacter sp. SSL99 TaxID=1866884 RepID=UPI001330918F|nr:hypothetical protein [Spiribacter sp. SSL99]
MHDRPREDAGLREPDSPHQRDELAARRRLYDIVGWLGQDPAITLDTRDGVVGVFTATSNAVLRPVALDGAGIRAEGICPAIQVSVWSEPWLDWVDSSGRRATWINRGMGLGAIQPLLDGEGGAPLLNACFELDDGLRWEYEGAALLRLFARSGADWMLNRTGRAVFARNTAGLTNWHKAIGQLPVYWFGSWTLLKRMPGHVIVRLADYDLADEAEVHIELNRPHPRLGSGLRYTLGLARHHSDRERLAVWCDWLNERETQLAIGTSHIGAWHIAANGRLAYTAFIPSLIGEVLPNLPRDLLCGSVARARAAIQALTGRLPL